MIWVCPMVMVVVVIGNVACSCAVGERNWAVAGVLKRRSIINPIASCLSCIEWLILVGL